MNTIEKLNQRIKKGEMLDIVMESETAYSQDITVVENAILENRDEKKERKRPA